MSTATTLITAEEFARMAFDGPVELVRGEVVEMPWSGGVHGKVCANAIFVLESWARGDDGFDVISNASAVITRLDPDTVRGPDVLVVRRDRLPGGLISDGNLPVPPEITIEVKSPSDRWREVIAKVGEYLACGIPEVWVLDPERKRLHVYKPDDEPTVLGVEDELTSTALPGFSCRVAELFRGV